MTRNELLQEVESLRWQLPRNFHDRLTESLYGEAHRIAAKRVVRAGTSRRLAVQRALDRLLTSPWTGFPLMALLFTVVLWITIEGSNVPSGMLYSLLVEGGHGLLKGAAASLGLWGWLDGLLIDGIYLTGAWVVSVMLPPMAIFFPLFTLLEDLGYLPRVAFNLDRLFQKAGAHGKQSLTMAMGLGCNAAGVIAARVIDSPRERLIAIITNNFSLCNGRWPTQIMIATLFLGAMAPAALASLTAAVSIFAVAALGFVLAFLSSWLLSRTVLKGEVSAFTLELPPYRPPNVLRTLYTSLIDRTLFVLWRAVVFAVPAGAVIWLISNFSIGDHTIAWWMVTGLDPLAWVLGLTGVILVAYIVAIPANEIVIPTILMLTVHMTGISGVGEQGAGVMFETGDDAILHTILSAGGWTTLTAVCLMLFSLCHNPCSTTIYTIYKETRSAKWTLVATFMPIVIGVALCAAVAAVWRLF
jgi:ferrous iron transport protein B